MTPTPPRDLIRLRQMLDHAREAIAFTAGKTLSDVVDDRVLSLALVRLLEVIGKAAGRVSVETRGQHPEIPWSQIIALRNRRIHGYDSVDMTIVWQVIRVDLPPLILALEPIASPTSDS